MSTALPVLTPAERPVEGDCPFCGTPQAILVVLTAGMYIVQCRNCSAQGPWGMTPDLTIAAWQSRGQLPWKVCPMCRRPFMTRHARQKYDRQICGQRAAAFARRERRETAQQG